MWHQKSPEAEKQLHNGYMTHFLRAAQRYDNSQDAYVAMLTCFVLDVLGVLGVLGSGAIAQVYCTVLVTAQNSHRFPIQSFPCVSALLLFLF